jgi:hypothetical protein
MPEEKKTAPYWLPALIAVIPITVAVVQYNATRQTEFRKRFWEEQLVLYKEALEAASAIAMSPDLDAAKEARGKFWHLYWGKLSMIEHKEVEQAMIAFGAALGACEAGTPDSCIGEADGSLATGLRPQAIALAHCIRFSLLETWNPAELDNSSDRCPYTERNKAEKAEAADG